MELGAFPRRRKHEKQNGRRGRDRDSWKKSIQTQKARGPGSADPLKRIGDAESVDVREQDIRFWEVSSIQRLGVYSIISETLTVNFAGTVIRNCYRCQDCKRYWTNTAVPFFPLQMKSICLPRIQLLSNKRRVLPPSPLNYIKQNISVRCKRNRVAKEIIHFQRAESLSSKHTRWNSDIILLRNVF